MLMLWVSALMASIKEIEENSQENFPDGSSDKESSQYRNLGLILGVGKVTLEK